MMTSESEAHTRGPYAKSAGVRQRILEAGMQAFAEAGYYATSLNDIADRAGISRRGLGHHFKSKEELLTVVLDQRQDEDAEFIRNTSGIDSLAAVLAVSTHNTERPGLIQLYSLLRADATAAEHPAHEHHRLQYDGLRLYLARAFDEVRAAGELNSDEDSGTLASTFLALMDGLQIQWLYNRASTDIDRVLRAYMRSVVPSFPQAADARPLVATSLT
ncbi:TetR/AcrR family transcriptional regulator [Microbacterium rhizomatis]|uniref:TetR/AcrR family transcriptional regulator n=2 Tax=Microbacterium rhizomatis TaxID=1631477 RepID=A0A5J5J228_9MICO|nr:TetR/AcrR family transcriptional regulator [Microbacterium rhizomatis]